MVAAHTHVGEALQTEGGAHTDTHTCTVEPTTGVLGNGCLPLDLWRQATESIATQTEDPQVL